MTRPSQCPQQPRSPLPAPCDRPRTGTVLLGAPGFRPGDPPRQTTEPCPAADSDCLPPRSQAFRPRTSALPDARPSSGCHTNGSHRTLTPAVSRNTTRQIDSVARCSIAAQRRPCARCRPPVQIRRPPPGPGAVSSPKQPPGSRFPNRSGVSSFAGCTCDHAQAIRPGCTVPE